MAAACPRCDESLADDAQVCRHCLLILDREGWRHDAGRLGADDRGGGRPLQDPPIGPLPIEGSGLMTGSSDAGLAGGAANGAFRLLTTALLGRRRRRR